MFLFLIHDFFFSKISTYRSKVCYSCRHVWVSACCCGRRRCHGAAWMPWKKRTPQRKCLSPKWIFSLQFVRNDICRASAKKNDCFFSWIFWCICLFITLLHFGRLWTGKNIIFYVFYFSNTFKDEFVFNISKNGVHLYHKILNRLTCSCKELNKKSNEY